MDRLVRPSIKKLGHCLVYLKLINQSGIRNVKTIANIPLKLSQADCTPTFGSERLLWFSV